MKRLYKTLCVVLVLLLLTACGKTVPEPIKPVEQPADTTQVLREESDLAVFDGVYRALVPDEADAAYVQIRTVNDFILLEHFLCMDGSVYSFWAEEFWPNENGFTREPFTSVSGMSQTFTMMTEEELYDTMPRNRIISLTNEGVVLNYDDSDGAYYVRDTSFSYHTAPGRLHQQLGESTGKEDPALYGTWVFRNGREATCVTFAEDGTVSLLRKKAGQPVQVYEGGFVFEKGGFIDILAEKIGDGLYPHFMRWQWKVDRDGMLWGTPEQEEQIVFLPTASAVTRTVERQSALGYLGTQYEMFGEYTDMYGTDYFYTYSLPRYLGADPKAMEINREIMEKYSPIIEEERSAMEHGEFLTFTDVSWESNVHEGVLYLHIYAKTWDWEEHSAYYYDVATGTFLTTEEVLDRLLIDQTYFLDAVREYAQAAFTETFSDLPEEYRVESGYYDMLEWTVSDEAVNLQLPIFVDRFGSIAVHARIGSMAGSGIIWKILRPFDGAVG